MHPRAGRIALIHGVCSMIGSHDGERIAIEWGDASDLRAMARYHYARGSPAPVVLALRAIDRATGERIGVLGVSMPALNGVWRAIAWPGAFDGLDRRARARALNELVRTISRVIVEPRYRGLGIGAMLVRAYLRNPLTPCTETIASMGRFVPLFERCGMRRVWVPRPLRDWRLLDALEHEGVRPLDLVDPVREQRAMRSALVRGEVDRWLNAARGTRGLRESPAARRAACAAQALVARPAVYVCGEPGEVST